MVRTGGHIVSHDIVGVADPEGSGFGVGGNDRAFALLSVGPPGQNAQVVFEQVFGFGAVLEEITVPDSVVSHVAHHFHPAGAVNGDATVETLVDGRLLKVLPRSVAHQVPVDGIAGQCVALAHAKQLHTGNT